MNKRQAKKLRNKQEMFICSFCSSYKELRETDRSYHEYVIYSKRKEKKCKGCAYYISESCSRLWDFEPCIYEE